jgi:asparagine synthase (glutamine-hydrolysing)
MCGIAGYINFEINKPAERSVIKKMTDCVSYRGPDGEGFFVENNLALGHRRLSIIDLDSGNQPMFSDNKQFIITFNGEIYNYIELREELGKLGHTFKTNSDTEVILKAFEHWGYDCQNKFNGMWAFAIWDNVKKELFLSRDRIGEKPLHYGVHNNAFVFGSEIKSLVEFGIPKEIRPELIEIYLTLTNIPAPHTFYKNIHKLMPGHFLIVRGNEVREKKYWDLPEIDEENMISDKKEVYENFAFLLEDSVKIRMRSDVPFGAFLSGGLDSSSIVALMAGNSSEPIKTFTIGFDDKAFDESKLAKKVADKFKTEQYRETISPDKFSEIINKVALHYDEPFGDSSAIPTGYVSYFAAKKVKMVLTGDGGDEVLSGYTSYQGIKLANLINKFPGIITDSIPFVNDSVAKFFKGKSRYKLNKISSVIRTANMSFSEKVTKKIAYTDITNIKKLSEKISGVIKIEDYISDFINKTTYQGDFYKLMYLNFKHDLPNDYLVKVDRMSMAYSLEARVPFLDHRLIEYMVKVDKNVKMQGWERKSVLRNTHGKRLPDAVLNASKKGFAIPIRDWFKESTLESQLNSNLNFVSELLDEETIKRIVEENKIGERDNGDFIWTLMLLNKFI